MNKSNVHLANCAVLVSFLVLALTPGKALAVQPVVKPVARVADPCTPRFAEGSVVHEAPALYSQNGLLDVRFSYQQTTELATGRLLHCFMTPDGLQQPTLHVKPGDELRITVTNNTPKQPFGEPFNAPNCEIMLMPFSSRIILAPRSWCRDT